MPFTNHVRDTILAAGVNTALTHIAVGSSTAAFNATHTNLQTPHTPRKAIVGKNLATNVITGNATWSTSEANGAWEEWGTFTALTAGNMLTRKVQSLGTKTSSQSWQLSIEITVTTATS